MLCFTKILDIMFVFGSGLASVLQEAVVRIINDTVCSQLIEDEITPQMFCAGILTGGVDACQVKKSNSFTVFFLMCIKSALIISTLLSPPSGWLGRAYVFWRPSNQPLISSRGRELGWWLWPKGEARHLHTGRQVPRLDQRGEWSIKCTFEMSARLIPLCPQLWPISPTCTETFQSNHTTCSLRNSDHSRSTLLLLKKCIPVLMNIDIFSLFFHELHIQYNLPLATIWKWKPPVLVTIFCGCYRIRLHTHTLIKTPWWKFSWFSW